MVVSARTGSGIEELRAAVEARLPRPQVEVHALVPYDRGDLINRIHQAGEFLSTEHTDQGTLVGARVNRGPGRRARRSTRSPPGAPPPGPDRRPGEHP